MQIALENNQATAPLPYEMSVPISFEAQLYFHTVVLKSREVGREKLKIVRDAVTSTMEGIALPWVKKVWDVLTRFCFFGPLQFVIQPYYGSILR